MPFNPHTQTYGRITQTSFQLDAVAATDLGGAKQIEFGLERSDHCWDLVANTDLHRAEKGILFWSLV